MLLTCKSCMDCFSPHKGKARVISVHVDNLCLRNAVEIIFLVNILSRFLGHFQPQQGKPAIWELDSDQHYDAGRHGQADVDEDGR